MNKLLCVLLSALTISACQRDEQRLPLGQAISIQWELLSNSEPSAHQCAELSAEWASCNSISLTLTINDNVVFNDDWSLYIHSLRRLIALDHPQFSLEHLTGDLYRISPTDDFDLSAVDVPIMLPITSEFFHLARTDFLPNAFLVVEGQQPAVVVNNATEQLDQFVSAVPQKEMLRHSNDNTIVETSAVRFHTTNSQQIDDGQAQLILPTPKSVSLSGDYIDISDGFLIDHVDLPVQAIEVFQQRISAQGLKFGSGLPVSASIEPDQFDSSMQISGAYRLSISSSQITIVGYDEPAISYGLTTLIDLVDNGQLPIGQVIDAPRFEYRGVMVDVARNFHSKAFILTLIDEMSRSKMNKLALHLSDDEGWRIEIPGLPELTNVGARRCFDLTETECLLPQLASGPDDNNFGSGYFSRDDFIEILRFADARYVDIIPEIDMPAHARSAVVSMEARYRRLMSEGDTEGAEQYRLQDAHDTSNVTTVQFYDRLSMINPCISSSKSFVDKVISEIAAMYDEAGVQKRTWHFGGDEAKNIHLGGGFEDITSDASGSKGRIDLSQEDQPHAGSPACMALVDNGEIDSIESLPSFWAVEVSRIADAHGFGQFQAWEDGLKHADGANDFATSSTNVNFWEILSSGGAVNAHEWADKGYNVIVSVPDYLYFDFPQAIDSEERGFYWATRANSLHKVFAFAPENLAQNASTSVNRDGNGFDIISSTTPAVFGGMSVQLWSEVIRTDEQAEYMMYPRLYAAAERAWHKASWELEWAPSTHFSYGDGKVDTNTVAVDYHRFVSHLGENILPRLNGLGVEYRIAPPGAIVESGMLLANHEVPSMTIEYSLDGGNTWRVFEQQGSAVDVSEPELIRVRAVSGGRSSRVVGVQ